MLFSLDVRRARKGDCLLLHFGSNAKPGLVLIDGGPKDVYKPHLRPRLMEIRKARDLDEQKALPVDLLMVSHVDDDHIAGILDLTRELREVPAGQPRLLRVLDFWHNSFDDILGNTPKELLAAVTAGFGEASLSGNLPEDAALDVDDEDDQEAAADTLKVLASVEQGHRLRDDARGLNFPLNTEFAGKLIIASEQGRKLPSGLKLTVAGPMQPELVALQKKHDEWLKEQEKKKEKDPKAALAAFADKSVPNLSSIVVLAEFGGKTILLTGDARGDKTLKGLELAKLLEPGKKIHVDVLKVPHHGSSNNVAPVFFERITADHYVLSGNGEHGNPERETLQMILDARGKDPFTLHFTYPIEEIDVGREADWDKERNKELARAKALKAEGKKPKKPPREKWSAKNQAIADFFKKNKLAKSQKLAFVDAKKPHVIDLLDPLGF